MDSSVMFFLAQVRYRSPSTSTEVALVHSSRMAKMLGWEKEGAQRRDRGTRIREGVGSDRNRTKAGETHGR